MMTTTATENVFIIDDQFYLPALQRHRRIWLYLPKNYQTSTANYPVIYMQDGQNLFDDANAFGSEWCVDETLDAERGNIIVVGIDNGGEHCMTEYMLHDHPEYGPAEGSRYLKDLTEVLKPFIDGMLRTLPGKEHTAIAGSSMGGLISLYAGLYFPHIFGAAGIFSPSLWVDAPRIFTEVEEFINAGRNVNHDGVLQRWYLYAGALESETMVTEVSAMVKILRQGSHLDVTYQLDADGIHDEVIWRNYFPNFYKWFTGEKSAESLQQESHIKIE